MKTVVYFFGGILFMTLISATTVGLMTIKPATPKSIVIKTFSDLEIYDIDEFVQGWVKKGFIVKSISLAERPNNRDCIVVLEKY